MLNKKWYKPDHKTAWQTIGDALLLQKDVRENSHAIKGTGIEIWYLVIVSALSVDDVVSILAKRYNMSDPTMIASDVQDFLNELEKRGFIIPSQFPPVPHLPEKGGDSNDMDKTYPACP